MSNSLQTSLGYVNDYVDLKGRAAGKLLSFSPGLHIVMEGARSHKPLHSVGAVCGKCRQTISGRNIFPVPKDCRALACDCLMVLFRAGSFSHDWIIKHWKELRRMKADAEAQLAAGSN
jgi:hypothetical protein